MSRQELEEFLLAMARLRMANTASPERARDFLREEGFLTKEGAVAEPYASSDKGPS
jgi:hypothetical protein